MIADLRLAFGNRRSQSTVLHGISLHVRAGEKGPSSARAVPASR